MSNFHSAHIIAKQQSLSISTTISKQLKAARITHATSQKSQNLQLSYDGILQRLQTSLLFTQLPQGNGQDSCEECNQSWYALFRLSVSPLYICTFETF